jgi:hypothetical protein
MRGLILGLAFVVCVSAGAYAQTQQSKSEPSIAFSANANSGWTISPATFVGGGEEVARCDKTKPSGQPYECHFVGKHTLDDVFEVLWRESEFHHEAKERAEKLKQQLKKGQP